MKPHRPGMKHARAVIDIGSNTVRMVIYGGPPRAPEVLHNEKLAARLGRSVAETGLLGEKAMGAALATLARFAALLRLLEVNDIDCVATAAVRDAGNGPSFLAAVAELGLNPRLLSGEEEALTSAMGVMAAFPGARGTVGDLGGGSLELVSVDGERLEHGVSLPLGTLRLPQLRAAGPAKFQRRIHKLLAGAEWDRTSGEPLYLVGGSMRALASFAMHESGWPIDDPHGHTLMPEEALRLARRLARARALPPVPTISPSRLATLPDTAALLAALLKDIAPSRVVFSSWGLREGVVYQAMSPALQRQHPLAAAVSAFTESEGASTASAAMIAGWTASATPAEGDGTETLRLAAIMLALAAQRIEPNVRAETVADWALRKRWIGLDAEGRAVLAAALCANVAAPPPAALARLASPARLAEGRTWGLAIRLCRRFSATATAALVSSSLTASDGKLTLSVHRSLHVLINDGVEKDMRNLANALGLQPDIHVNG